MTENHKQITHSINWCATAIEDILEKEPFNAFIVAGSPEHFFIQLESIQDELDRIEALLKSASTWAVFNKTLIGQMCAARFGGRYYRGIILSSDEKGAFIYYIDYGDKAVSTDLRKLPDDLLCHRHLAINCRVGSKNGTFSPQLIGRFENLSRDDAYEMKFVDKESQPAIVELFVNGELFEENQESLQVLESTELANQFNDIEESNKKLDETLDKMNELLKKHLPREMPKFTNPTSLQDGDHVVIRYVESPTLVFVQQTKSIADYDVMMDRLCDYCAAAPTIHQPQIGMACVAFYNSDSEWYRAEILDIGTDDALTRFVDYGIELTIRINHLKEIGNEFLLMPKQAIPCCILGFESLKATKTVTDKLEFLAESSSGDRRKFQVITHGIVNGTTLVNLIDLMQSPILDLSMLLLQLSLPEEEFLEYRRKPMKKRKSTPPQPAPSNADVSWINTVNSQLCRIATEHVTRQLLSQFLFSLLTVLQSQGGVFQHQNPTKVKKYSVPMRMISNHLSVQQSNIDLLNVPNMTLPTKDHNMNNVEKMQPPTVVIPNEHYIPIIESSTLLMHSKHEVYVSHVDDGPYMFSIQLKSSQANMQQMMALIATCSLQQLSREPALGMACLARYSADDQIYRAVIKSIHLDSCQLLYVDYGNSEKVPNNNIYDIPEQYLRPKSFAIRVSLAGLNTLPPLSDHVKNVFKEVLVADRTFDMVVVPPDENTFAQYCELNINGQSMLNYVKDVVNEIPNFIEPTALSDGDFVVIRYVESPKLFYVQQTKNIVKDNAMIDKLCNYCLTAPPLNKFEKGVACASRYRNDSEWYRAEIVSVSGTNAMIRFVDYGIELQTEVTALKEIHYDFLMEPKQVVPCCLLGFESMQTVSNSSQDQMDLLAEDSLGNRRNFRVAIHRKVGDVALVNLTDESQLPHLDFSLRMLQLNAKQN